VAEFVKFACSVGSFVTIGAYDINDISAASKYGVIEIDPAGRILSLQEKPKEPRSSLISMCLYYYPQASLSMLKDFVDETHNADTTGGYIQWLFKKTTVYGFKFSGKWYDIGSLDSYDDAQKKFLA
jgi:glucose-1-phosphate thymidylyltransferase